MNTSQSKMASPSPISPDEASRLVGGADKIKRAARDFPPVASTAASKLVPIFEGKGVEAAWTVQGFYNLIPYIFSFPCTMTVYRAANGELTIFNALRLSVELEDDILALGRVAHVVKLGQFHGGADAYCVLSEKFGRPRYWTLLGGTVAEGLKADAFLAANELPIEGAKLYRMEGHPFPEAVLTVPFGTQGPLLISCDSLFHLTSTAGAPFLGRIVMNILGIVSTPEIPHPAPIWCMKTVQMLGKDRTKAWFDEIFELEWHAIIGAHGTPVLGCDREATREAVYKRIGI